MGIKFAGFRGASGKGCGCCSTGTLICIKTVCPPSSWPVAGAVVQLYSGGVPASDPCTTDATGCCTFTQSGTYQVRVTISGTLVAAPTKTLAGTEIDITITDDDIVCCNGYAIPKTLTATDARGSFTMAYCPTCPGGGTTLQWTGGHAISLSSSAVDGSGGTCAVLPASVGPVRICYLMGCNASSPILSLRRSWSYVFPGGGSATYYQDSTGFVPGQNCSTGPPAFCGANTDAATGTANPSGGAPFAVTFSSLAPGGANVMADPVGGSVAVSA